MDIALLMKMQRSSVYAVFECWPIKKHAMQCVADLMVNLNRLMQQAACTGANACHNPWFAKCYPDFLSNRTNVSFVNVARMEFVLYQSPKVL